MQIMQIENHIKNPPEQFFLFLPNLNKTKLHIPILKSLLEK